MESNQIDDIRDQDDSPANALEIDETTAAAAEDLMRSFAEEAELETVLLVDWSGALVAGISAEPEVTVELISALVAGASGAMRALVARLGGSGALESLHLGGDRLIYLKELAGRFVLVAASDASRPPGIVRRGALAIEGALAEIVKDIRLPAVESGEAGPAVSPARSLRQLAKERAARRAADLPSAAQETEAEPFPAEPLEEPPVPCDEEPSFEETFETLEFGEAAELEETPGVPSEPKEILEPIDFDEPEILIESSSAALAINSPFEAVEEEEPDLSMGKDEGASGFKPTETGLAVPKAGPVVSARDTLQTDAAAEAESGDAGKPDFFYPEPTREIEADPDPPARGRIPEVVPPDPFGSFFDIDVDEAEASEVEESFEPGLPEILFEFDGEDDGGDDGFGEEDTAHSSEVSRHPGPFEIVEDEDEDEDAGGDSDGNSGEEGGLRSSGPVYF